MAIILNYKKGKKMGEEIERKKKRKREREIEARDRINQWI